MAYKPLSSRMARTKIKLISKNADLNLTIFLIWAAISSVLLMAKARKKNKKQKNEKQKEADEVHNQHHPRGKQLPHRVTHLFAGTYV